MTPAALLLAARAGLYHPPLSAELVWDIALLGLLLVVAAAIVLEHRLFAVVMYAGAYSLLSAVYLVVLDAVDVAFTEAAVGAGVSTILMLGAMLLTARNARPPRGARKWLPALAVAATGALLLYATRDMPGFGDPESPANAYVGRAYLARTPAEIGAPNVVTAVLASYRGYDTLGETVVIFTAGLGVMLLLGLRDPGEAKARSAPPRSTPRSKAKTSAAPGARPPHPAGSSPRKKGSPPTAEHSDAGSPP